MPLATLLLPEFHSEMTTTRRALAALPEDQNAYQPHQKSMALAKLAAHTAMMPAFISIILTTPELNVVATKFPPLAFDSRAQLQGAFDAMVGKAAAALEATSDASLEEPWKLLAGDRTIFAGSRYESYRVFGMNHMIHHRAQLGVYLRLLHLPVPSTYGPSADSAS